LFGCITLLLALILTPVVFELVLRIALPLTANPLRKVDPLAEHLAEGRLTFFRSQFYWELVPNSTVKSKYGATYSINSMGFNWREFDRKPPDGKLRIVTMGDSSAFGWEVKRGESLAASLEREFDARYPRLPVEFINCGVPGHTVKQGLILLQQRVLGFRPDIITITYGWNDWRCNPDWLSFQHELVIHRFRWYLLSSWLLEHSRLAQGIGILHIKRQVRSRLNDDIGLLLPVGQTPGSSPRIRFFRESLDRLIDVCRARHIDVMFLPVSTPEPLYRQFQEVAVDKGILMVNLEPELRAEHDRIIRAQGLPLTLPPSSTGGLISGGDFDRIRGDQILFLDSCHPNPRGYTFIAGQVAPQLRKLVAGRLARSVR